MFRQIAIITFIISILFVGNISLFAQYGGVADILGESVSDYPNEPRTQSTTVSAVAGETKPLPAIVGIKSLGITFKDGATGTIDYKAARPSDLPGSLPTGKALSMYSFGYKGFSKDSIDSISMQFKVKSTGVSNYNQFKAYIYNSPAQEVSLRSLGVDNEGNTVFETKSIGFSGIVLMGSDTSNSLIRTGGKLVSDNGPYIYFVGFWLYLLYALFTIKKAPLQDN